MELLPTRGRKPGRQNSLSACRHKKNVRCSKQRSPGSVRPKMYPLFCPRSRWNPDSRLTRDLTRHQSPKGSDACAQEALAGKKKAGRAFVQGTEDPARLQNSGSVGSGGSVHHALNLASQCILHILHILHILLVPANRLQGTSNWDKKKRGAMGPDIFLSN